MTSKNKATLLCGGTAELRTPSFSKQRTLFLLSVLEACFGSCAFLILRAAHVLACPQLTHILTTTSGNVPSLWWWEVFCFLAIAIQTSLSFIRGSFGMNKCLRNTENHADPTFSFFSPKEYVLCPLLGSHVM